MFPTLLKVKPMDCNLVGVKSDSHGLEPDDLQRVMSNWNPSDVDRESSDIPKLLYLIPNGGNPTGHALTLQRKQQIYKIAQKYNLLILEDDPYFYLQFNKVGNIYKLTFCGKVM